MVAVVDDNICMTAREALLTLARVEMETELDGGGVRWWGWGTEGARSTPFPLAFFVHGDTQLTARMHMWAVYDRQRGGAGGQS